MTYAWVLNLDAEHELERPDQYLPSRAAQRRLREHANRVLGLVGSEDVVLWEDEAMHAAGRVGRCWCPTPRALRRLERAGALLPSAPPLRVLQRVNHRRFGHDLAPWEPSRYAERLEVVEETLRTNCSIPVWVAKRAFGFSGRGRRRLRWPMDAADRTFCMRAFTSGQGVLLEPWVERCGDFVLHGELSPDGTVQLGRPLRQVCNEHGVWLRTESAPPDMLDADEHRALLTKGEEVSTALHVAGYFGPFGIDAFRHVDEKGRRRFRPLVEINARYGMGWAMGMARATEGPKQRTVTSDPAL